MVIDVLRWSTVVVTALAAGAPWVEAYATPDEARARADVLGRPAVMLGGERGNVAIPGFDLGNSPGEYDRARLHGRGVITTTTNGTQGLLAAREAEPVLVAAFVNLDAVVEALRHELRAGRPIALVACGQAGEPALEDVACAGAIATALGPLIADAGTDRACAAWARTGRDPEAVMAEAPHAATLRAAGFAADVRLAARSGVHRCVPRRVGAHRLQAMPDLSSSPSA